MTKQTYEEWRATRHLRPNFEQDQEESSDDMWQEIVSYYINLNRRRRKITQKQIAEALKISQPGVCQMLKASNRWQIMATISCHGRGIGSQYSIR